MKKIVCGILLYLSATTVYAKELSTYDSMIQQLSQGKAISILIDAAKCKIDNPNNVDIPPLKWLVTSTTFGFNDSFISADSVKFASGRPPFPDGGIIQRGSAFIYNNGDAKIIVSFYNAETNQKFMKDVVFQCSLNSSLQAFTE